MLFEYNSKNRSACSWHHFCLARKSESNAHIAMALMQRTGGGQEI